jgi:hypothetical protein
MEVNMAARRTEGIALLALQAFAALSAIAGGIALITGTIELPSDWLNGTLFSSYTVPGVILAMIVGGSQLTALLSSYGRRDRYLLLTAMAGGILMGWIVGELIIVGAKNATMFGYQLIYFVIGFMEFALASQELRQ